LKPNECITFRIVVGYYVFLVDGFTGSPEKVGCATETPDGTAVLCISSG